MYTSTKAKILFLNSHQRARKVPVTRIIPTNSTLPFAWSKISTKEFQSVYLVIWQSKAKGTTVFHFLRFEILTMRLPKIIDMSVLFLRFVSLVISEPKRPIALIHWVYEVKEATIWKLVFFMTRGLSKWSMIINQPRRVMHVIENKTSVGYAGKHHQWSEIIAIKTAGLQLLLDLLYNFYWSSNEIWLFYFFYFPR